MRNDATPGMQPMTNGLQINVADAWVNLNSFHADKFGVNATFYQMRINPKLLEGNNIPLRLHVRSPSAIEFASGDGKGTAPTAAAGGKVAYPIETFLQAQWLGPGGDLGWWAMADVTQVFEYLLQFRRRSNDEIIEGS